MNEWLLIGFFIALTVLAFIVILCSFKKITKESLFLLPIVIVAVIVAYQHWGAWAQWQNYTQDQITREKTKALLATIKSPAELVEKLKAQLNMRPESAHGWYLLGRLYGSQNQWEEARDAFATAHHLNLNDEATTINYAQSLWQLNQQQFNTQIRDIFKNLLIKNPDQPDALAMLAMDAYEQKNYKQANQYWTHLLKMAPPGSEEAKALRKAIAKTEKFLS